MLIRVVAIGRLGKGAEMMLCADYAKRAAASFRPFGVRDVIAEEFRESRLPHVDGRQAEEGAVLLERCVPGAVMMALDERGRACDSRGFADTIRRYAETGTPEMVFAIGGPDGHGEALRQRADRLLAFGAMTLPHKLARIVLLEQLYRAATIIAGHPYHRD